VLGGGGGGEEEEEEEEEEEDSIRFNSVHVHNEPGFLTVFTKCSEA
jgi:hypothetical protein